MPSLGVPDYINLDARGEARRAAHWLEERARMPASHALFEALVRPLLDEAPRAILEVGCGTAALARRIAAALPGCQVHATDKSEGMLSFAREQLDPTARANVTLAQWDATQPDAFPFEGSDYDLIVSSVLVPYLDDAGTTSLVRELAAKLRPGGVLAFVEQDALGGSVYFPRYDLLREIYLRDAVAYKATLAVGLRPVLREAGLLPLEHRSFLWRDEAYAPYTRQLLEGMADQACARGRVSGAARDTWKSTLSALADRGEFYYGLVYHLVAGQKGSAGPLG